MWFSTAAMAVFAIGQVGMLVAMIRVRRAKLPSSLEGRRRMNQTVMPWLVVWVACASTAAVLVVVGDPGLLIVMCAVVVFVGIILATAFVVGRKMERENDAEAASRSRTDASR